MWPTPESSEVDALSITYRGAFALDFAYEEWASPYRETLHARYLETLEMASRRISPVATSIERLSWRVACWRSIPTSMR